MTVDPVAAEGFTVGADAYERGRPSYPPEAITLLTAELELGPGRRVLDLGAGTGKMTALLAATGADVVAIEPVAAMRERLVARLPGVEALEGTAEAIPLPRGSVDAVVVAQSFHWFEAPVALAEIARVLRPHGGLALVWGVTSVKNLAQGDFIMLGGYTCWFISQYGVHPLLGVPLAALVLAAFGWVVFQLVITKVIQRDLFTSLLATFGLAIFLQQSMNLAFGPDTRVADAGFESWQLFGGAVTLRIPHEDGAALALCYERGRVLARVEEPRHVVVDVQLPGAWLGSLAGYRVLN